MFQNQLTLTEKKVINKIALSKTTNQIAGELQISSRTVDRHRANICKKLNISGSNSLIKYVLEHKEEIVSS